MEITQQTKRITMNPVEIPLNIMKSDSFCSLNAPWSLVKPPCYQFNHRFCGLNSGESPAPATTTDLSLLLAALHGSKGSVASGGLGVLTTHANAWDRGQKCSSRHGKMMKNDPRLIFFTWSWTLLLFCARPEGRIEPRCHRIVFNDCWLRGGETILWCIIRSG